MALLQQPTLARLLKETRIFLGQLKEDNSFWKDDELTLYINDGLRHYFTVIAEGGDGQFDTSTTLALVANQETVPLPTDCYEVRALYIVQTDRNAILRYDNNITDSYTTLNNSGGNNYQPTYYFRGEDLVLRPMPNFSNPAALVLEYTKFPETLITGGDVLTKGISPIFKELVVKYAVYQAKLRESSVRGGDTYLPVQKHLSDLFQNFKNIANARTKYPQFIKPFNP